jgi:PEP-CTERM motif
MIRTTKWYLPRLGITSASVRMLNSTLPQISRAATIPIGTTKFLSLIGTAAVLVLLASAPAAATQMYDITFTSSAGMDATGTISISGGVAQSGSINVTGVPIENTNMFTAAAGSLVPGSGVGQDHNGDDLPYDNLVNFANNPILTGNGIDFGSGQYDATHYDTLIGLWGGDANGNPVPNEYTLFVGQASFHQDGSVANAEYVYAYYSGSLTSTPVPEPSTLVLFIAGLAGLGLVAMRKRLRRV